MVYNLALYTESKDTPKKEAENSRLVVGMLNKQWNLPPRLVLISQDE